GLPLFRHLGGRCGASSVAAGGGVIDGVGQCRLLHSHRGGLARIGWRGVPSDAMTKDCSSPPWLQLATHRAVRSRTEHFSLPIPQYALSSWSSSVRYEQSMSTPRAWFDWVESA